MAANIQHTPNAPSCTRKTCDTIKSAACWSFGKTVAIAKPCAYLGWLAVKEVTLSVALMCRTCILSAVYLTLMTSTVAFGLTSAASFYDASRQPSWMEKHLNQIPDQAKSFEVGAYSLFGFTISLGILIAATKCHQYLIKWNTPPAELPALPQ